MPTAKQLQNAKSKLKKTNKPTGNKPTIPTAALLRLLQRTQRFVEIVNL